MESPQPPHEAASAVVSKVVVVWSGVFLGLELTQWAALAGLVASMLASIYTAFLLYVLIRDRIYRDKPQPPSKP